VVDERGGQLGVMAIGEALFKSRQVGLDLVEVAPEAKPPVCKIIDFKKFKYQEDKKQKAGSKKTKQSQTKEIRFTPFIAQNDYETRVKRAKEFLEDGDKVRVTVKFVGRQITRKQFGYELLKKVSDQLSQIAKVDIEPKWQGRLLTMLLAPVGKK
jgi:translation initiation factor IF-3